MVFSSIPAYLDPANWQQRPPPQNHQQSGGNNNAMMGLLPPPPPPPPQPHGSGGAGSIRPGSMTDRARMANIPMPETALKCPRCDSTNTKFCYFNNYSLSQPRHFCKTCRRYWTRGGALRSVPVGGGCRRNKRTKATSKSPAASGDRQPSCSSGSTNSISSADHIFGLGPQGGPLRFMSPLHGFSDFGGGEIGLSNLGGLNNVAGTSSDLNFHSLSVNNGSSMLALEQQWRPPQFPFLGEPLYPFDHQSSFMGQPKGAPLGVSAVKVEGSQSHQHNIHPMSLLGNNISGNDQFWSGGGGAATSNPWTDLSGFSSSSTSHP